MKVVDSPSGPETKIALLESQHDAKKLAALKTLDLNCYRLIEIGEFCTCSILLIALHWIGKDVDMLHICAYIASD